MKLNIIVPLIAITTVRVWQASAQMYDTNNVIVETFAGSAFSGYLDGQGTQTMFNGPVTIEADLSSNLFVFDYYNNRIRKITPSGAVSTFAGGGTGSLPGYGTNVSIGVSEAMAIDHSNTLYVLAYPTGTSMLRVGSDGFVSTVSLSGLSGGGRGGICVDSGNNVYISDSTGDKIYRYRTNGVLEVFVGSGNSGSVDGNGIFTSFNSPQALAADSADNIYIWDSGNNLIRRANQNRDVTTIAGRLHDIADADGVGTNAIFNGVSAMCADNIGNIYITSYSSIGGSSIRKMSAATNVTTLAGSFTGHGYANGAGSLALFDYGDEGICFSQGMIFVADFGNARIRQIAFSPQPQVVSGANLGIGTYAGLTITGVVGRTYQVQTSPDMTNWTTHATLLLTSSPHLWIDQNPVSGSKFYRALLLP